MTKKLCIFDLDGTLINSLYDLADSMNFALKKHGFPVHDREKYRFMVGCGISVLADRAMVVPEGTDSEIKAAVLADFNDYYESVVDEFYAPIQRVRCDRPAHACPRDPLTRRERDTVRPLVVILGKITVPANEVQRLMNDIHLTLLKGSFKTRVSCPVHDRVEPPVQQVVVDRICECPVFGRTNIFFAF